MPRAVRQDDLLLRVLKDLADVRSALRRVVSVLPLFDIDNENTPALLTANQDDYNPGNYDVLRLESNKIVFISGISRGIKGRKLRLFNVGEDYSIVLKDGSTDSVPANRFSFQRGTSPVYLLEIPPLSSVQLYYDSTLQRWLSLRETNYEFFNQWTAQTPANANTYTGIAYSESLDLFAAVGNTGVAGAIQTSPDGVTWTARTVPGSIVSLRDVVWSEDLGLFVAVGGVATNGYVATSPDGVTWTARTPVAGHGWIDIAWSSSLGLFVAVSDNPVSTAAVQTSPDGITWTTRSIPTATTLRGIAWSPSLGIFLTYDASARTFYSSDGINWTEDTIDITPSTNPAIAWSELLGIFVVLNSSGEFARSTDGTNWNTGTLPESNSWWSLHWSDIFQSFIGVSTDGTNRVLVSQNGITWSVYAAAETKPYRATATGNNIVVVVGDDAVMTTSS